jgi:N-methylhydantoinase A
MRRARIGVDIGGTFTDAVLLEEGTGQTWIAKVPTTPRDPAEGFLQALDRVLAAAGVPAEQVGLLAHGTTVATNAIIEGKTARVGFITTAGFRDLLEIQRQIRPRLYDLFCDKPPPLVPRRRCVEVRERVAADGTVLEPLDAASAERAAEALAAEGVEAVVICLLHSYRAPAHERQVAEVVRRRMPEAFVSISSEVCPEFREYWRASTACINAGVMPIVARYLDRIERGLSQRGIRAPLNLMESSGGVMSAASARARPVAIVECGPAAGVMAAGAVGARLGAANVISFDMGGTTAKAGLIQDGRPRIATDYEVGFASQAQSGLTRAAGYPLRTPVLDLAEIGAGGGSLAWVDAGGILRVGPHSAGADPGPAAYGKGGTAPTVTDANLLLGRIDPAYFLGGEVRLDLEAARASAARLGARIGLDPIGLARGILEIANANMVGAIRLVSVQRGYDPREFVLVAFGGAGPLHAAALAEALHIPEVVIPPGPGLVSALGLLVTDLRHDFSRSALTPLARLDPAGAEAAYRAFEREAEAVLRREGVAPGAIRVERALDLRYVGQSYELTVPLGGGPLSEATLGEAAAAFHRAHERAYGHAAPEEPVEAVTLKLTATGAIPKPPAREVGPGSGDGRRAKKGERPVHFGEAAGAFRPTAIYDRYRLGEGDAVAGPAIVEELDSTTLVPPGSAARVDRFGHLRLRRA